LLTQNLIARIVVKLDVYLEFGAWDFVNKYNLLIVAQFPI